jgi:hypothetical protein
MSKTMKWVLTLALGVGVAFGQIVPNAVLPPVSYRTFVDANGHPLPGGKLYTCAAGSAWSYPAGCTTPLATYTDYTGATPNSNPIVLDSAGRATWRIGPHPYKLVLTDSTGVVQWTDDNVQDAALAYLRGMTSGGGAVYIATETGSNNAIAAALLDSQGSPVPLASGLTVMVRLAHSLRQVGSNTFTLNGTTKSIAGGIASSGQSPYAPYDIITLVYDGTSWRDISARSWNAIIIDTMANRPATAFNGQMFMAVDPPYNGFLYVWDGVYAHNWVLPNASSLGPWNAITLQAGWTNIGSPYASAHYRETAAGQVFVEAFIAGGVCSTSSTTTLFTLPAGYRRPDSMMYSLAYSDGTVKNGYLLVGSDGTFKATCPTNPVVWISINLSYWTL